MHTSRSRDDLALQRKDILNYVTCTPNILATFTELLDISEPSETMEDCDVWKCSQKKTTEQSKPAHVDSSESSGVRIAAREWPMPLYASRKLVPTEDDEESGSAQATCKLVTSSRERWHSDL